MSLNIILNNRININGLTEIPIPGNVIGDSLVEDSNELAISSFNRKNCKTGIVHLGIGNFHRAHQANYINEYLNTSNNLNWGICGINLRKEDSKKFDNLKLKKGKYILKTISTSGEEEYKENDSMWTLRSKSCDCRNICI